MKKPLLLVPIGLAIFLLAQFTSGENLKSDEICLGRENCVNGKERGEQCEKPNKYGEEPDTFPTYEMGEFVHDNHCLLRILADLYFAFVNEVFGMLNALKPMQTVHWANASQLLFKPALEVAKLIRERKISSKQVITAYAERLAVVNPIVNGMHHDNFAVASKLASEYDEQLAKMSPAEREQLAKTKPFFGVPFTSKDNLMAEGFTTSACNMYLMKNPPSKVDAPIVMRMKKAGAILLAITTMPNLGLSWAGDDTQCLPAGQTVNNPHDTRRISGGSSAGEGVLISSAGSLMGIGNDIGGSVRVPSSMNGIFGLKPTNYPNHTVPVEGIVPDFCAYKPACDMLTNGPLVRYASDLPTILAVMAGKPLDYYNKSLPLKKLYYLEDLDILISEGLHEEQREQVRKVKSHFEENSNVIVQLVSFPLMNQLFELFGLNSWSPEFIHPDEILPEFWQIYKGISNHTFLDLEYHIQKNFTTPKSPAQRKFVKAKLEKFRKQVNDLLGNDSLLLTPVWPSVQPFHHMEPFQSFNLPYTMTWNLLGNPALVFPTGKSSVTNLPLGVQLVGSSFNEHLLVSVAQEMEKVFGGWVKPGNFPDEFLNQ